MSIGALSGEAPTFLHDVESFFWVLYWICCSSTGPNKREISEEFEKWNFQNPETLADIKTGKIAEWRYEKHIETNFTKYYRSLIPWAKRLCQLIFPHGKPLRLTDDAKISSIYTEFEEILTQAINDKEVCDEKET
jgi:hypothetical protein